MKNIFLALTFLISISLNAAEIEAVEIETLLKCEQTDGDRWVEVGIALNDGPGYELIAVQHEDDDVTINLLGGAQVFKQKCFGQDCYVNSINTMKLVSSKGSFQYADFFFLKNGPGSIRVDDMACFKGGSIKYNSKKLL